MSRGNEGREQLLARAKAVLAHLNRLNDRQWQQLAQDCVTECQAVSDLLAWEDMKPPALDAMIDALDFIWEPLEQALKGPRFAVPDVPSTTDGLEPNQAVPASDTSEVKSERPANKGLDMTRLQARAARSKPVKPAGSAQEAVEGAQDFLKSLYRLERYTEEPYKEMEAEYQEKCESAITNSQGLPPIPRELIEHNQPRRMAMRKYLNEKRTLQEIRAGVETELFRELKDTQVLIGDAKKYDGFLQEVLKRQQIAAVDKAFIEEEMRRIAELEQDLARFEARGYAEQGSEYHQAYLDVSQLIREKKEDLLVLAKDLLELAKKEGLPQEQRASQLEGIYQRASVRAGEISHQGRAAPSNATPALRKRIKRRRELSDRLKHVSYQFRSSKWQLLKRIGTAIMNVLQGVTGIGHIYGRYRQSQGHSYSVTGCHVLGGKTKTGRHVLGLFKTDKAYRNPREVLKEQRQRAKDNLQEVVDLVGGEMPHLSDDEIVSLRRR